MLRVGGLDGPCLFLGGLPGPDPRGENAGSCGHPGLHRSALGGCQGTDRSPGSVRAAIEGSCCLSGCCKQSRSGQSWLRLWCTRTFVALVCINRNTIAEPEGVCAQIQSFLPTSHSECNKSTRRPRLSLPGFRACEGTCVSVPPPTGC